MSLQLVSQTIRKVRKDETYWRCQGSWISHQKKSVHSTPTDVLRVEEICLEISSPLIVSSPDDCCRRGQKVKEQDTRGGEIWADLHIMEEKGESFLGGQDES